MKKQLSFLVMLLGVLCANAQSLSNYFTVGPYEVEYVNEDIINYRLRDGVDLYKYYNLAKDTIISNPKQENIQSLKPMENSFGFGLITDFSVYSKPRYSTKWGVEAGWKHHLWQNLYFNAGLSFSMTQAKTAVENLNFNAIELALPLSVEWNRLAEQPSSAYCAMGVVPTFATTMSSEYIVPQSGQTLEEVSGMGLIPRVDFGAYVPVSQHLLRVGIYGMYRIDMSQDGPYHYLLGRTCLGAAVGLIF